MSRLPSALTRLGVVMVLASGMLVTGAPALAAEPGSDDSMDQSGVCAAVATGDDAGVADAGPVDVMRPRARHLPLPR